MSTLHTFQAALFQTSPSLGLILHMPINGWSASGPLLKSTFQFSFIQKKFAVHAPAQCESKHSKWRQLRGLIFYFFFFFLKGVNDLNC